VDAVMVCACAVPAAKARAQAVELKKSCRMVDPRFLI
jgi:hypothetical protein